MSTHGILTEPSLSPHYRKGREGKGREQEGRRVACDSIHRHLGDGWLGAHRTARTDDQPATMDGRCAAGDRR